MGGYTTLNLTKNHKGLGRISTLGFGLLLTIMALYGGIYFVGGFAYYGGYTQNAVIQNAFNAIALNPSAPSGIFNIQGLTSQVNTQSSNFTNSGLQTDLVSTITTAGSFFTSFATIGNLLITFILAPFALIGIPTAFISTILTFMIIFSVFLAILYLWSLTVQ